MYIHYMNICIHCRGARIFTETTTIARGAFLAGSEAALSRFRSELLRRGGRSVLFMGTDGDPGDPMVVVFGCFWMCLDHM